MYSLPSGARAFGVGEHQLDAVFLINLRSAGVVVDGDDVGLGMEAAQLLAVRVTNFDGLTDPVAIETPPMAESRSYQNTSVPYAVIDIRAEHLGFDRVIVQNAQVFPDTETRQELSLIPTPELPSSFDRTETFVVPPQNLS